MSVWLALALTDTVPESRVCRHWPDWLDAGPTGSALAGDRLAGIVVKTFLGDMWRSKRPGRSIVITERCSTCGGMRMVLAVAAMGAAIVFAACGGSKPAPGEQKPSAAAPAVPAAPESPDEASKPMLETEIPDSVRELVAKPFFGDLGEMVQRRIIRVGVTFNRTFYFVDHGQPRGVSYEYVKAFEDDLNKRLKTGNMKVSVFFVPVPRDLLLRGLTSGRIDVVVAQLTKTPDRLKVVDFANSTRANVSEVVVTGPGGPTIESVDDLSGKDVFVRKTSSYYQSLLALNDRLKGQGKPPVIIRDASENLEDDDLLEMVNAGLIPAIVVDDYLAEFWKKVFPDLNVHSAVAVHTGGELAPAIRKNSPQLATSLNEFIARNGIGTAFGNVVQKRYLVNTSYARNAASREQQEKLQAMVKLFKKYGGQYNIDFLLAAAQGYQESTLDQGKKSPVGAIGVMQVMPETGKEQMFGDITQLEPNIHAGVKYMRFMMDQYFKDDPMDELNKGLMTFASYNAGPGKIRQLRKEAEKRGLDPNVWFGNVEQIASERIGRETVTYVSNIYKYYIAYRLVMEQIQRRDSAKAAVKTGAGK
jgi:membrane-bound lytic murein transglycosylase MltF